MESKKRKIIIISTVGLIYDGITSVILSYLQAMDLSEFDIYIAGTIKIEPNIRKKIEQLGCSVVELPSRRKNPARYFLALTYFIWKNRIKVMHAHGNSATLAIEMLSGWISGCKKRIAHSHNTQCEQVKADKILRPVFNLFYTDALACGDAAGKWLFGNQKFMVLQNGRDIDLFAYDPKMRKKMREKYAVSDIAIGHVGGFVAQKNHEFLLEIYQEILKQKPNVKLFMIGDGELKEHIEKKAERIGIRDHIIFTGNIDNVAEVLQAMDGMVLPSLFEGLPLVMIEWQILGLPCVISDVITKECICTEQVQTCSLHDGPDIWAKKILKLIEVTNRKEAIHTSVEQIKKAGFDIQEGIEKLKTLYLAVD